MNEQVRPDSELRRELARDARELKDDRAFKAAMAILRTQLYNDLLDPKLDMAAVYDVRAKLQVLELIPQMLQKLMNDEMMAQRQGQGRRY